jgi:hypothetical protein
MPGASPPDVKTPIFLIAGKFTAILLDILVFSRVFAAATYEAAGFRPPPPAFCAKGTKIDNLRQTIPRCLQRAPMILIIGRAGKKSLYLAFCFEAPSTLW